MSSRVKSQGSFFEHVGESSRRRVESFLVFDDDDDVDADPVERGPHVTHDHPPKKVIKTNQNQH